MRPGAVRVAAPARCALRLVASAIALATSFCASGCQTSESISYGDPVGVSLEGKTPAEAYEVAVAATKGREVEPLVPAVAGGVHAALKQCPGFVPAEPGRESVALQVQVVDKAIKTVPDKASDAPSKCMLERLQGAAVPPAGPPMFHLLIQVRHPPR